LNRGGPPGEIAIGALTKHNEEVVEERAKTSENNTVNKRGRAGNWVGKGFTAKAGLGGHARKKARLQP